MHETGQPLNVDAALKFHDRLSHPAVAAETFAGDRRCRAYGKGFMLQQIMAGPARSAHGSAYLTSVDVESYNVALKDENGFVGDRASKDALRNFVEQRRK